jgi:hypothetical protein
MREREWAHRAPAGALARREGPRVRRRLTVGPADDPFEREADEIAARVMADLGRAPATLAAAGAVQRRASGDGPVGPAGGDVPASTASRIRPTGDRFDDATRSRMEGAFGADFSGVRVHTSATVDTAAEGLQADAFTLGRDVYVRRELYRPGTTAGDRLLAHELTHTIQQGGARIHRSTTGGLAADGVRSAMPADRVSRKKKMMYLDFVRMKRYDPKYGKAIKETLGFDVDDDSEGGTFGHWWTEVGDRDPDTDTFTHTKSYGWWPMKGVGGVGDLLGGVAGGLNKGKAQDPHAGETGEAGLTEFHPAYSVDPDAETYDAIRKRVSADIDNFATGYAGKWHWKLGWGKNCHTFQQSMKTTTKLHYQKATGWLVDPGIATRKQAVKAQADQDSKAAQANLALVSGAKWYTYDYASMAECDESGDEVKKIDLGPTKEFAVVGQSKMVHGFWCKDVIARTGQRCWVTELELKQFSNM